MSTYQVFQNTWYRIIPPVFTVVNTLKVIALYNVLVCYDIPSLAKYFFFQKYVVTTVYVEFFLFKFRSRIFCLYGHVWYKNDFLKGALAVNFVFFTPLQNLRTRKNKHYKRVFGVLFRLERKIYIVWHSR